MHIKQHGTTPVTPGPTLAEKIKLLRIEVSEQTQATSHRVTSDIRHEIGLLWAELHVRGLIPLHLEPPTPEDAEPDGPAYG